MRAFYRIDPTVFSGDDLAPETCSCVELYRTGSYSYLYSGLDPNPELEEAGAERVADSWSEFAAEAHWAVRDSVFLAEWEATDPDGDGTILVRGPRKDVPDGVTPERDWLVPVAFSAGESELAQAEVDAAGLG